MTKHAGVTYVDLDGVREMKEVNVNTTEKFISDVGVATYLTSISMCYLHKESTSSKNSTPKQRGWSYISFSVIVFNFSTF